MWLENDDGRGRDILWLVVGWSVAPLFVTAPLALLMSPASVAPAHLGLAFLWLLATLAVFGWRGAESHRRRAWDDILWMGVVLAALFIALRLAGQGGWTRFDALLSYLDMSGKPPEATTQGLLTRGFVLAGLGAVLAVAAHDCAYRAREALEDFGLVEPRDLEDEPVRFRPQPARPHAQARPQGGPRAAPPPPPPSAEELREASACAVLGLRAGASKRDILKAHRTLMKRAHPDHGGSTEAATRLNAARDFLLGKGR
jgi:hypothetical protein